MERFDERYRKIENEVLESRPRNLLTSFLERQQTPVVLYGAGGNCECAMFTCAYTDIPVTCVCDSRATGVYEYKGQAYKIISPKALLEQYKDAFVLITSWQYEQEIYDSLCTSGFPDTQIYFLRYPDMLFPEDFRTNYLEGYRWAYDFFKDEHSKQRILDRIRQLLLGTPCPPDALYEDGHLTFPGIKLKKNEVYIDGGAYVGDTAEDFINKMKENGEEYKHIYAFEPDIQNYKKAVENLSHYNDIDVLFLGLWSSEAKLNFTNSQETDYITSQITQNENTGSSVVPVTSLDSFFKDKPRDEWPTIIKLDIEGAEKEALLGATAIIKERKPQLIICAYHKPEDIYELPQTILNIRDDYQFSLWQIGESFWDMILYAV